MNRNVLFIILLAFESIGCQFFFLSFVNKKESNELVSKQGYNIYHRKAVHFLYLLVYILRIFKYMDLKILFLNTFWEAPLSV